MVMCFTFVSAVLFLGATCSVNGKKTMTYTINNQLEKPFFHESLEMSIVKKNPLIWYMEKAVLTENDRFRSFKAIFKPTFSGYFIKGINSREAFWSVNRTNWQLFNTHGLLPGQGVSHYIPVTGDSILFNYTIGCPDVD